MRELIRKVVIWGHKLHSHTHSYINFAFHKAFTHLGYDTYWFDNNDDVSEFDFSGSLFITEGQVDSGIPICKEAFYVLHNCDQKKYEGIDACRKMILQVYTHDARDRWKGTLLDGHKLTYYGGDCLWQPWATDLLPDEIDENINKLDQIDHKNIINFVGMVTGPWNDLRKICMQNSIGYREYGGFNGKKVSTEENIKLIQESLIAPALQSKWQVDNGYIPCRIFKNISYGKVGMTNSKTVYDLFEGKVLYDENLKELVKKGILFERLEDKNKYVKEVMETVRDNHTYLNRIETILWFFDKRYEELSY